MFLNIQNDSEIYYLHFNIYFFTNVFNLRLTTNNLIRDSLDHYRDNKKQWGKNLLIYNGILKKRKALLWINICTYLPDRSYLCSFVKYSRVKKNERTTDKIYFSSYWFLITFYGNWFEMSLWILFSELFFLWLTFINRACRWALDAPQIQIVLIWKKNV